MHRLVLRTVVLLLATTVGATLRAQAVEANSLRGIREIEVTIEPLATSAEEAGLHRADIQTDVELKLRLAGIKVLTNGEWLQGPGSPYLYVNANVRLNQPAAPGLAIFSISLQLKQLVTLTRDVSIMASATTWDTEAAGSVGRTNLQKIRDGIRDLVDEFINAYLSVNPKK
jgi:hypothetical protein